jgi:serine/threonine-protein kinase
MNAPANLRARALALVRRLLDEAPTDRETWLAEACAGDAGLLDAARVLLGADEKRDAMLDTPLGVAAYALPDEIDSAIGERVGPYRLIDELGRGGMGAVYSAERVDGIAGHRVAIKMIKRGMDSDEMIRRFRQEREILARLIHPHIARLLDGGIEARGRLWFAMELVDGKPITQACEERGLGLRERIRYFLDVCEAVQFAHINLVVHRDLKPSNVLLDASDSVKLLDFGIGKILDVEGAQRTHSQVRMLTPEFAAPEQVRGDPVTTATDVYQLGLLLTELLAGCRSGDDGDRRVSARSPADRTPCRLPRAACIERACRAATVRTFSRIRRQGSGRRCGNGERAWNRCSRTRACAFRRYRSHRTARAG